MLASLSTRNLLLFRDQHIRFGEGLNVISGETGAGKSMLLACLGFVLGERKFSAMVNSTHGASEVTAVFHVPKLHPANAILNDIGIPPANDLVLRRCVSKSGRGESFVNDRRCTAQTLGRLAYTLIEIHGQDSSRRQMNPSEQRAIFDSFAELTQRVKEIRALWKRWQEVSLASQKAEQSRSRIETEIEYLSHAIDEIKTLNPEIGEEEKLTSRRSQLKSLMSHLEDLQRASESLGANGAEGRAADALRYLQNIDSHDGATNVAQALEAVDRAMIELNEASRYLEGLRSDLDSDPHEIERVEERLHEIRRLARKHATSSDQLVALADQFSEKLTRFQSDLVATDDMPNQAKRLESDYKRQSVQLSKIRWQAAARLDKMVASELPALKLKDAQFRTEISEREPGPEGEDTIHFVASTNAATPAGPIHQIASGGEFSRFMLALKVCLTSRNSGITMIFDEVDRDVGGATADAVGRRLRSLATNSQVLVVTHSPQVAAYGDCHLKIEKKAGIGTTNTEVLPLSGHAERVNEIARMLSGETISVEAEAAAVTLLKDASVN